MRRPHLRQLTRGRATEAAALGFDEGAQLLLTSAVRLGRVPAEQVEQVLQLALVRAVLGDQQLTMGKIAAASAQHDRAELERTAAGPPAPEQRDAALVLRLLDSRLAPAILRANAGEALTADQERRVFELAGIDGRAAFAQLAAAMRANWEERLLLVRGLTEPGTLIARDGRMWAAQLPDGATLRYPSRKQASEEIERSWRAAFDANGEARRGLLDRARLLPQRWVDAAMSGDELPAATAPPAATPNPAAESFAYGSDPTRAYAVRYRVIDLDDLVPSNLDSGAINPAYDAALQPRQRDRAASQIQIEKVARTLTPDALLTDFKQLDKGTPILGPEDRCVESGNGRVLALRQSAGKPFPHSGRRTRVGCARWPGRSASTPRSWPRCARPSWCASASTRWIGRRSPAKPTAPPVLQMSTLENAVVDAKRLTDDTPAAAERPRGAEHRPGAARQGQCGLCARLYADAPRERAGEADARRRHAEPAGHLADQGRAVHPDVPWRCRPAAGRNVYRGAR